VLPRPPLMIFFAPAFILGSRRSLSAPPAVFPAPFGVRPFFLEELGHTSGYLQFHPLPSSSAVSGKWVSVPAPPVVAFFPRAAPCVWSLQFAPFTVILLSEKGFVSSPPLLVSLPFFFSTALLSLPLFRSPFGCLFLSGYLVFE